MSMQYQNAAVVTNKTGNNHVVAPTNNYLRSPNHRLIANDDDDEDYVEMSPAGTPSRSKKIAEPARSPQTQKVNVSRNVSPYKGPMFEDNDYEDMSGRRGLSIHQDSPSSNHRHKRALQRNTSLDSSSPSISNRDERFSSTKAKQTLYPSKSQRDFSPSLPHDSSLLNRSGAQTKPVSIEIVKYGNEPWSSKQKVSSPILEGAFHKNDDDDYADVNEVKRVDKRFANNSSTQSAKTKSPKQSPNSPSQQNSRLIAEHNLVPDQLPGRTRSGGMLVNPGNQPAVKDFSNRPIPSAPTPEHKSPPKSTKAGKAALKFLQTQTIPEKESSLYEMKRTGSTGVVNSPRAGVQSRIHRSRQSLNQSRSSSRSEEQLSNQPPKLSNHQVDDDIIDMEAFVAKHKEKRSSSAKSPSRNKETVNSDLPAPDSSFKKLMRQGSDGSQIMKFISEGAKSRSLDKNYVEWLVKTSPYASRTSSINESGSKHNSISDLHHAASLSLGTLIDVTNDEENDEAFKKYMSNISLHQKERKSPKKSSFWNRSKKNKSKSIDNLKTDPKPPSPTTKESKNSRKSLKNKSKKIKEGSRQSENAEANTETPDSHMANQLKENLIRTYSDDVLGKPPSSPSWHKKQDQFSKTGFNRSRTSSSSSGKSSKKSHKKNKSVTLEHDCRSIASHTDVNISGHKRNHSETLQQVSEGSTQSSFLHKRNNSDVPNPSKPEISVTPRLQSSLLDISLASNYDDDPQPLPGPIKPKYSSMKSNTIGRIFGRKTKERKSLDNSNIWNGALSGSEHRLHNERWGSLQYVSSSLTDIPLRRDPPAQHFMKNSFLVHGFLFQRPKRGALNEKEDHAFSRWSGKKSRTLGPMNKYTTFSGLNSLRRGLPKSFKADSGVNIKDYKNRELKTGRNRELLTSSTENESVIGDDVGAGVCEGSDSEDYADLKDFNFPGQEVKIHAMREKIAPISQVKNERTLEIGAILFHCITSTQPEILANYNVINCETEDDPFITGNEKIIDQDQFVPGSYVKGCDLVSWLLNLFKAKHKYDEKEDTSLNSFIIPIPPTRKELTGMWQILLEEGAICHVKCEEHFEDTDLYYGFHADVTLPSQLPEKFAKLDGESHIKNGEKMTDAMLRLMKVWSEELDMADILAHLKKNSHDAIFRKALRKPSNRRTLSELKMIYEEVIHFNSIRHLSDTVKRELARVLKFESHSEEGKILFRQGDDGTCWYIILKGSVNVEVNGKGVVGSLQEGDDFGSLALLNNAPRSATIILAESEVHLIRVDKSDYFRILKNIEENTLRLQEHGKDVLVLEKISSGEDDERNNNGPVGYQPIPKKNRGHSYSVTAGTPERILQHILEYLQPWQITHYDETLENFILMYSTFMKSEDLFKILLQHYRCEDSDTTPFDRSTKRKIVYFVVRWSHIMTYLRAENDGAEAFLQELADEVKYDSHEFAEYSQLRDELSHIYQLDRSSEDKEKSSRLFVIEENVRRYQPGMNQVAELLKPLQSTDQTLVKVYNSEQTYATVKVPLTGTAEEVVIAATEKLFSTNHEDVILIESMECGDRIELPKDQRSVATAISLNSCLCVCEKRDSFDLKKVPKPISGSQKFHLDDVSSLEIAFHVTQYDWHLFNNVHVLEYVYKVFGVRKFQRITPNLDILARRFNQLAYWPPTEICSCSNANKRAMILRKFIKVAQHLKRHQNMNAFMAIMIGIGNQAVSRLSGTWEKLPARYRKMVQEFEAILDPSRNHHSYRIFASSMEAPYLPYFPLLMKDMTFQHEGNDNQKQELVNFEKMHMISSSIRTILEGCCSKFEEDSAVALTKTAEETKKYAQSMQVITDQRVLNEMSAQLEAKR